jgi:hypothetical protein
MGIEKNFTDELAKHKLLVYFVILWGASLFVWTAYGMVEYGFEMRTSIELYVVDLLFHFSELFAGLLLIVFGLKLMNTNLLKAIKNERLLTYFLILWAASFFFWGLWYIIDFGPAIFENIENPIAFLGALAKLFAGAVLGLFSVKLLNETE